MNKNVGVITVQHRQTDVLRYARLYPRRVVKFGTLLGANELVNSLHIVIVSI